MLLEVAILNIIAGKESEFETAFRQAEPLIMAMDGYVSHQLQCCLENSSRYVLFGQLVDVGSPYPRFP